MIWLRKNHFTLLLMGAVALAFLVPEGGRSGGALRSEVTTRVGIMLIFLMQGLGLATRTLAAGLLKWRLHVFIQSWNFLFAPALLWLFVLIARPLLEPALWNGFWFLAILPTTVSSAVALTAVTRGDVAGAIFNTTLSNVLGIFLVPLWAVALFSIGESAGGAAFGGLLWNLSQLILLPLIAGQLLQPLFASQSWFQKLKPFFQGLCSLVILFIIYAAFSDSVADDSWAQFGLGHGLRIVIVTAAFLGLMAGAVWLTSPLAGSDRPTRLAAFFCGSQKTLAAGVPMAQAIFAGAAAEAHGLEVSLLILPLMAYHALQLLLAGVFVGRTG